MLMTLVKNEFLKQKRKPLILIILMIPIGISILLLLDLTIRYESWLLPRAQEMGITSWEMLLKEQRILYFNDYMPLFSAIIIGELFENEYKNNGWVLTMIQPIKREMVLLSKYITSIIYLITMLFINIVTLIGVGNIFKFSESIPWNNFFAMASIQLIASCAVMVIHLFLSIKNKNVLISFGIAAVLSIVSSNLYYNENIISKFNPYNFALFSIDQGSLENITIYINLAVFIIIGSITLNKYFKYKKVY